MKPLSSLTTHRLSFSLILDSIAGYFMLENRNFEIYYDMLSGILHLSTFRSFYRIRGTVLDVCYRPLEGDAGKSGGWAPEGDLEAIGRSGWFFFWLCAFVILLHRS